MYYHIASRIRLANQIFFSCYMLFRFLPLNWHVLYNFRKHIFYTPIFLQTTLTLVTTPIELISDYIDPYQLLVPSPKHLYHIALLHIPVLKSWRQNDLHLLMFLFCKLLYYYVFHIHWLNHFIFFVIKLCLISLYMVVLFRFGYSDFKHLIILYRDERIKLSTYKVINELQFFTELRSCI